MTMASCCPATQRKPRVRASEWDGVSYGYGRGRMHFCVETTVCPSCGQGPGKACKFRLGLGWVTHADRREVWREQRFAARKQKQSFNWAPCSKSGRNCQ